MKDDRFLLRTGCQNSRWGVTTPRTIPDQPIEIQLIVLIAPIDVVYKIDEILMADWAGVDRIDEMMNVALRAACTLRGYFFRP